jgi:lactoylglutathione lyase
MDVGSPGHRRNPDEDLALRPARGRSRAVAGVLPGGRVRVVGDVPETGLGHLTMLKLPDDEFVTIELVHQPGSDGAARGPGLSHFVITVESMAATVFQLAARGIDVAAPSSPEGEDDFLTTWITDPDGNRIELVQWPAGHPDGLSAADWAQ